MNEPLAHDEGLVYVVLDDAEIILQAQEANSNLIFSPAAEPAKLMDDAEAYVQALADKLAPVEIAENATDLLTIPDLTQAAISTLILYGLGRGDLYVTQGQVDLYACLDTVEERKRNEMVQTEITDFLKALKGSDTYCLSEHTVM